MTESREDLSSFQLQLGGTAVEDTNSLQFQLVGSGSEFEEKEDVSEGEIAPPAYSATVCNASTATSTG